LVPAKVKKSTTSIIFIAFGLWYITICSITYLLRKKKCWISRFCSATTFRNAFKSLNLKRRTWTVGSYVPRNLHLLLHFEQGDQVGRIFAFWATVYLLWAVFFINYQSSLHFWATFSKCKVMQYFFQKMGWATFWAIFRPLATLILNRRTVELLPLCLFIHFWMNNAAVGHKQGDQIRPFRLFILFIVYFGSFFWKL
jgi:hypothetical protein